MTASDLRTDVVILACAISAGIHAGLAPEHIREATGVGLGFAGSTAALAVIAVVLTRRPDSEAVLAVAAIVLAGLVAAYALAVTTGVPVLLPEPEPVDGIALFTKAVEVAGLLVAVSSLRPLPAALAFTRQEGRTT